MTTASTLFAVSQNSRCEGSNRCHWCGAPCKPLWRHDDPPPVPFTRTVSSALYPREMFVCQGCWLWNRPRVTVFWLSGGYKDGQCAKHHSWWIGPTGAAAISRNCKEKLLASLLKPPQVFSLSLLETTFEDPVVGVLRGRAPSMHNLLHLCLLNEQPEAKADTVYHYTLNNIPHRYTVYELEQAIKGRSQGMEPGVSALMRLLAPPKPTYRPEVEEILELEPEKQKHGRPKPPEKPHKVVRQSGRED